MEQIEEIIRNEDGNITGFITANYRFSFPVKKRLTKDSHLQEGDVFEFNCQGEGGTPFGPLAKIKKPGLPKPIYSEIVPSGCIISRMQ
jgi:hypothetical protein